MHKYSRTLSVIALTGAAALLVTGLAEAQPRRGIRGGGRVIVTRPYFNPWFYNGWYGSPLGGWYGGPFGGWYGSPFGYRFPPYGYGGYYRSGDLRLEVEPRQAEVFVDGYYAGVVDDFDGTFQRLRVEPGEHDIQLYLPGYRSLHQKLYVQADKTFRIRETMQPLAPGDAPEPRPDSPAAVEGSSGENGVAAPGQPRARRRGDDEGGVRSRGGAASIAIRVQPADAEVFVDGEPWQGAAGADRLVIQLAAGEHRIEVRKAGYAPFESTVRVRPGDSTPLNISLTRE